MKNPNCLIRLGVHCAQPLTIAILMVLLLILNPLTIWAQVDSGCIGDVKYSILDEAAFQEVNGKNWVLLKGQFIDGSDPNEVTEPSDLFRLTGIKQLPDARGVFLRGANLKRDPTTGDTEANRSLGSYQADAVKKHKHDFGQTQFDVAVMHGSDKGEGGSDRYFSTPARITINISETGPNLSGEETRPRNICLFVYIKINR